MKQQIKGVEFFAGNGWQIGDVADFENGTVNNR